MLSYSFDDIGANLGSSCGPCQNRNIGQGASVDSQWLLSNLSILGRIFQDPERGPL